MPEIRSGNLVIRTRNDKIEFGLVEKSSNSAFIDSGELPIILEFLKTFLSSQSNHRTGFRIDISQLKDDISNRFRVFVETADKLVAVSPIDLSISGLCVESEQFFAENGARVNISLSYDDKVIVLPSIVVRKNTNCTRTAFHFIDADRQSVFGPPSNLKLIYRELEVLWLDSCLNLEWIHQKSKKQM